MILPYQFFDFGMNLYQTENFDCRSQYRSRIDRTRNGENRNVAIHFADCQSSGSDFPNVHFRCSRNQYQIANTSLLQIGSFHYGKSHPRPTGNCHRLLHHKFLIPTQSSCQTGSWTVYQIQNKIHSLPLLHRTRPPARKQDYHRQNLQMLHRTCRRPESVS